MANELKDYEIIEDSLDDVSGGFSFSLKVCSKGKKLSPECVSCPQVENEGLGDMISCMETSDLIPL